VRAPPSLFGAVAVLALLAGCASGPDKPKPKPLDSLTPQIAGRQVWSQRIDAVQFPLSVAVSAGVFTVAGNEGSVLALQADTGRELWRANLGSKLGAGVGSDGRVAAVVTREGELVAIEAGRVLWRMALGARVTTAPLVAGERVFVLGTDRSVQAFDALDGRKLWSVQRPGDPLTLAQAGVISAFKDTLLVGQGARLAGLDPRDGSVRFEVALASPRGTNEVERLADLVAPASRVGDVVCVRSFQAAVGCVNAQQGSLSWTKVSGGTNGVAADEQYVFGADASDRLTAWSAASGDVAWSSDKMMHRGLSAPLIVGKTVVFGDAEGTLHFLSRDKGDAMLRLPTDGSAIIAAPVASGSTMLVVTRSGGLFAFRPE
jgi:outer membrane protein assembly factor BamB